jgi:lysophospholipase L1-like esterase
MRRTGLLVFVLAIGCDAGAAPSDAGRLADAGARVDAARLDGGLVPIDAPMTIDAALPLSDLHFVGRFDFSPGAGTPWLAWPGSEIVARFRGTSISVRLDDGGEDFFDAWIDGMRQPPLHATSGAHTYPIASGLPDTEHTIRLVRRTESLFGRTQFLGFPGATLVPSPPPYPHLVEIIGDSITCGYGVLGVGPSCAFAPDTESEPDAYAAIATRMLGVGHVAIAYSGRGVVHNYGGTPDPHLPVLFERRLADFASDPWDFSYTPDVVVITLGTNDFAMGDPGSAFVDGYDAFVMQLRAHYPSAWILIATSPMLADPEHAQHRSYLAMVMARAASRGDAHVSIVDFDTQLASDGYGCDYHPSAATQMRVATQLVTAIRDVTGW